MRKNLFVALLIVSILASFKNTKYLSPHLTWQLNAYTNWNLILIFARILLKITEWDQFLCVNSVGIWFAFNTAFCHGLDENIRKKLKSLDFSLSPREFKAANFVVHTLPMIGTSMHLINNKKRISFVNVSYALILATWFAFRQNGKLDASKNYVPHPWKMSWLAGILSMIMCPHAINAAIDKKWKLLTGIVFALHIPYSIVIMDDDIRKKYNFEFLLQQNNKIAAKEKTKVKRSKSDSHFCSIESYL